MDNTTALIFGYNKYALEIKNNLHDYYKDIKILSLNEEDVQHNVEHFDLSDDWASIEYLVSSEKSIVFCALENDAENIFLTISLRAYFKDIMIISLSSDKESANKLKMAGANKVVPIVETTANIIKNILRKPISNDILRNIIYENSPLKIAQIKITENSHLNEEKLSDIDWTKYNGIVLLSIMHEDMVSEFIYSSKAKNHIVKVGDILVVIGYQNDIDDFKKLIGGEVCR